VPGQKTRGQLGWLAKHIDSRDVAKLEQPHEAVRRQGLAHVDDEILRVVVPALLVDAGTVRAFIPLVELETGLAGLDVRHERPPHEIAKRRQAARLADRFLIIKTLYKV